MTSEQLSEVKKDDELYQGALTVFCGRTILYSEDVHIFKFQKLIRSRKGHLMAIPFGQRNQDTIGSLYTLASSTTEFVEVTW